MLDICLLGTGGMLPLYNRWLTSLMLRYNGVNLLIDSGEGTQITIRQKGWSIKDIEIICFTHYHADHISGLPGLLLSMGNAGKMETLTLVGPKGLEQVVTSLRVIAPELPFDINFVELNEDVEYIKHKEYHITAYKVMHQITCYGYNIEIRRGGKFDAEKAKELNIPVQFWSKLQSGETAKYDDKIYYSHDVVGKERKGIKISYCTDSRPTMRIANHIKGADIFICEGMYGDDADITKAEKHMHMTFKEAATLAQQGSVKKLWLTHFSPALVQPDEFLYVAKETFINTVIGYDRLSETLKFEG